MRAIAILIVWFAQLLLLCAAINLAMHEPDVFRWLVAGVFLLTLAVLPKR